MEYIRLLWIFSFSFLYLLISFCIFQFHVFVLCSLPWLFCFSYPSGFSLAVFSLLLNLSVGFFTWICAFYSEIVATFRDIFFSHSFLFLFYDFHSFTSLNNFNILILKFFQIILFLACWGQSLPIFASTDWLISVCVLV